MGCWDVFDIITGFSAGGGPRSFLEGRVRMEELADGLAEKIIVAALSPNLPSTSELKQILIDALVAVSSDAGKEQVPFPYSGKSLQVVLGNFGGNSDYEKVSIRFCRNYDAYGSFEEMLVMDKWKKKTTHFNDLGFPFMDARCWHYICAWVSYPSSSKKSLVRAVYDALADGLNATAPGISLYIDYGPMCFMWGQFQDSFLENCSITNALKFVCLNTAPNLSAAISRGLRGKALAPALFSDFQVWMFADPDLWPHKPQWQCSSPIFRTFEPTSETPKLLSLPVELILKICSTLSLPEIFATSSASKSMRQLVIRPDILHLHLHSMITSPDGSLRWLQPCSLVKGEVDRASEALRTWVNSNHKDNGNPFCAPDFPFVEFVYTCLVESDSMRNRKRLWGVIKQVEFLLGDE
ncbi:hypothetical protein DL96DRAFT_1529738 [Flagelloscypha sp. PMI_526]|nr:hypothetical protein DL96DRAFT_1529738 [Flagelloscypha sp. PMI_526]